MEMVHFIPPTQRRLVILAAQADTAPVLICGAAGTGKGAIAQWIHHNGPRAGFPYVEANHETPLVAQIPAAQGGTLVVPELAEWPLAEQMALLQFLKIEDASPERRSDAHQYSCDRHVEPEHRCPRARRDVQQ